MEKLTRKEFIESIKSVNGGIAQIGAIYRSSMEVIIDTIEKIDEKIKYGENDELLGARTLKEVNKSMNRIIWSNNSELRLNNMELFRYRSKIHCYLFARDKEENGCTCVYVCHKNG